MITQYLLFDLDDTLIHCNRHFVFTRQAFVELMMDIFKAYPVDRELIADTQKQVDISGVAELGLGKNRFPESLLQTYRLLCEKYNKPILSVEEQTIFDLGFSVYDYEVELYPQAMYTLEKLVRQGHELYLYTGGDFQIQTQKVVDAGLEDIFPEPKRFITEYKNTNSLKKLLLKAKLRKQDTWMIGNSPRSDICPALEVGIHAIHIPDDYGWAYDHVELDIPAKGHFHVLRSIADVPMVIEQSIASLAENVNQLGNKIDQMDSTG